MKTEIHVLSNSQKSQSRQEKYSRDGRRDDCENGKSGTEKRRLP